ncbi:MAG: DUF6514 family protein [Bacillota bacterium]|nr:DUF6514 family protein [Bacillota bacterium]
MKLVKIVEELRNVVQTDNSQMQLSYRILVKEYQNPDDEAAYVGYGISVKKSVNGEVIEAVVPNITTDADFAAEILEMVCRNGVTPIALTDVITDIVTEHYMDS